LTVRDKLNGQRIKLTGKSLESTENFREKRRRRIKFVKSNTRRVKRASGEINIDLICGINGHKKKNVTKFRLISQSYSELVRAMAENSGNTSCDQITVAAS